MRVINIRFVFEEYGLRADIFRERMLFVIESALYLWDSQGLRQAIISDILSLCKEFNLKARVDIGMRLSAGGIKYLILCTGLNYSSRSYLRQSGFVQLPVGNIPDYLE